MRILHLCLAAFYIDNFGYQENILPKMHKKQGHEVLICASTENYVSNKKIGYVKPSTYLNEDGIKVIRLPYIKYLPHFIARKLRLYIGLFNVIKEFEPDILFIHDIQFLGVKDVVRYLKKNKETKVFVDGHTDFINSGKNWFSKHIMHGIVYKWCAQYIEPFVLKFYGTLPLRADFYQNVYSIPKEKLDVLVLGADDTVINLNEKDKTRVELRQRLKLEEKDFVLICGGKIDKRKNIHNLMEAVVCLNESGLRIKLLVFGIPTDNMKSIIERYFEYPFIYNIGWLNPNEIYPYLFSSDLACFPGTHSVLWEQSVGVGLPCLFRRWERMTHVDVGGNCIFLEEGTKEECIKVIRSLVLDPLAFEAMKKVANEKGIREFSYSEIAKRAIEFF